MFGVEVHCHPRLCQLEFVGWRRTHRRKRIAKKWRKKYGAIERCKGRCYEIRGVGIIVCPCAFAAIEQGTKWVTAC